MTSRKIPEGAFEFFAGLGAKRSYEAVAQNYGVSRQAVYKAAKREGWKDRVAKIDRDVREGTDQRITESLEEMNRRHIQMLQVVQRKALETLRTMPLSTAMEAVRAADLGIKGERTIRGEPSDRTAISLEGMLREQYESWFEPELEETEETDVENDEEEEPS